MCVSLNVIFSILLGKIFENENHLHLERKPGNMTNIHRALMMNTPQQPAHISVRSRMVASFKFVAYKPSTPSSSFGVLGFLLAGVS